MEANATVAARTRPIFWLALALLLGATVEAAAHVIELTSRRAFVEPIRRRADILREQSERIAILLDATRETRDVLDPRLGWRYKAGYASATDHINAQGLRARREYAPDPGEGVLRVAAFGDSFVYGNEVGDADAWCAVLEASSTSVEVLNYGVGGYGLDQAFLRFAEQGMALRPHVVLIGFTPDDLRRVVNVYRRFISTQEWPLAKPRFVLRGGRLVLVPNPLARREDYVRLLERPASVSSLGSLDAWYSSTVYEHPLYDVSATLRVAHAIWQRVDRRTLDRNRLLRGGVFNESSDAFVVQVAVLQAFADAVQAHHIRPIVLMLPNRSSLQQVRSGAAAEYEPLQKALFQKGVPVWDGAAAFARAPDELDALFAPGGHYSATGNRSMARWLAARFDSLRVVERLEPPRLDARRVSAH